MRHIIMPHVANPWLLEFWLRNLDTYREKCRIDSVAVVVSGFCPESWVQPISEMLRERNIRFAITNFPDLHGHVCEQALGLLPGGFLEKLEDTVVVMEEDCYVLAPEGMNAVFQQIEDGKYDVAMIPRSAAHQELHAAVKHYYGRDEDGAWPCCFFASKKDLIYREETLNPKNWPKGEHIKWIDYTPSSDEAASDTFTSYVWELRYKKKRILELEDNKVHAYPWWSEKPEKHNTWSMHIGSLSGAATHAIRNLKTWVPIALQDVCGESEDPTNSPHWFSEDRIEVSKRIAAWRLFGEECCATPDSEDLLYEKGLDYFRQARTPVEGGEDFFYQYYKANIPLS
jgi:hypothetical protein